MSEATPAAPAAPATPAATEAPATPPPSSPVDFQARAAAVLREANAEATKATEKPAAPPVAAAAAETPAGEGKPPAGDEWATKFAQLNEAQRRHRSEVETDKARLREEREAVRKDLQEADALRQAKASGSPVKALVAMGWSYEDATAEVLGKPLPGRKEAPEEAKVDPKVAALEQKLAALEAERAADREAQGEAQFRAGLVKLAADGKERFEFVRELDAYDEALEWAKGYVKQHGALPGETPEKAMEAALAHVERKYEETLLKPGVLTSTKLRSKLQPVAEAPKPAADRPQATSAKSPPPSLTNSLAAAAPPRSAKPEPRTPAEYQAAAAAVLRDDAG